MNIWQVLEIEPTTDFAEIKKAYAIKLKKCKPEIDSSAFQLLRQAYEIAQKYAVDINVNCELDSDANPISTQSTEPSSNASDLVYQLLDVLAEDQDKAANLLNEYQQKGWLDNLAFSEQFQKIFAINLLALSAPSYYGFTSYVIDFFQWYETSKNETSDSYYRIALTNLINQTRSYRFLSHLKYLSRIKNKKEAKENDLDWHQCCAAKMLINPARRWKFAYVSFVLKKQTDAMVSLINLIKGSYPESIGLGLSISSVAWWENVKTHDQRIYLLSGKMKFIPIGVIILNIALFCIKQIPPETPPVVSRNVNEFTPLDTSINEFTRVDSGKLIESIPIRS